MPRPSFRPPLAALLTCLVLLVSGRSTGDPRESTEVGRPTAPDSRGGYVTVTYLANEGVLISGPPGKILIDALIGDGLLGYERVIGRERQHLERARPPYDDIDLVLATHFHRDHFNAAAVLRYLRNNTEARFVSTPQAVAELAAEPGFETVTERVREVFPEPGERVEIVLPGLRLQALHFTHGPRRPPVQNLGYLIEIDGLKLLHLGDSEAGLEDFQRYGLNGERIDVALVPFWYFLSAPDVAAVRDGLRAHTLVPLHVPAADAPASFFSGPGGRDELLDRIEAALPNVTAFHAGLRQRRFPVRHKPATDD